MNKIYATLLVHFKNNNNGGAMTRFYTIVLSLCFSCVTFAQKPSLNFYTEISPPGNYLDESGILVGSSVEMIEELNRLAGYRVKTKVMPWTRAFNTVLKTPNTALFSTSRTSEREQQFHWIGPLLRVKWVLYKHYSSALKINSLEDAKQIHSIAATRNDAKANYLLSLGFNNLDLSEDNVARMRKLYANHNDVILTTNLGVQRLAELAFLDPNELEPALEIKANDIYLAFTKDTDTEIIEAYQKAYRQLFQSAVYYEIIVKWYGEKPAQEIIKSLQSQ
ncbi:amino acid ABC transporter substrate-binding protein [Pseudoalteromonas tunicata]|uniref:Solute-binding protein family 3/N-terminal domain-containing protein n=2 Tax=Pseudoalteromonas tunicata TaxID=314281 RepID=A4CE19_9GAMM|nr:amino acid ABC transporter substrate-binding protein [Pseudoalteromonas tunicata]EAR27211.1 hypothetical protein PTD2_06055 [Pseudoalteromonas tunicata D2]